MKNLFKNGIVLTLTSAIFCQSAFTMEVTLNECMPRQIKKDADKAKQIETALSDVKTNINTAIEHLKGAASARKKKLRCELMLRASSQLAIGRGNLDLVDYLLKRTSSKKPSRTIYDGRYDKRSPSIVETPFKKRVSINAKNVSKAGKNCKRISDARLKHFAKIDLKRVEALGKGFLKKGTEYSEVVSKISRVNKDKIKSCDKLISGYENKPTDCRHPDYDDSTTDWTVVWDIPTRDLERAERFPNNSGGVDFGRTNYESYSNTRAIAK